MGQPDSSLTPEQRLLKLIEDPQSEGQAGAGGGMAPKAGGGKKFSPEKLLNPETLKAFAAQAKSFFAGRLQGSKDTFSLKQVIWLVRIAAIVIFFYLAFNLALEYISLERNMQSITTVKQKERTEAPSTAVKNFGSVGLDEEEHRNVFVPAEKKEALKENTSASMALIDLTKDLRLTGISADPDNPDRTFCMIEDLKKNVTTVLKKGDTISGMAVGSISSDEVTLTYNNEKIQLR